MLTRAGWTVAALAALAIVAGRLVGSTELFVVGGIAAMVVVVAVVQVVVTRPGLGATRTVRPNQVHAGDTAVVELSITNHGRRRSPIATVIDSVGQRRQARVRVAALDAGHSTSGRYQLATDHRGHLELGPLRIQIGDPFGLARIDSHVGSTEQLLVLPSVDRLPAPPLDALGEPDTAGPHRRRWTEGEEFHALRVYATGDDLRRVHWPTSARVDDLMVRHDEARRQARTVVVLDTRSAVHTPDSFEQCVSAAASVLIAAVHRGDRVGLATTVAATPQGGSSADIAADDIVHLLGRLATVDTATPPSTSGPTNGATNDAAHVGVTIDTSGVVVMVTTTTGATDIHELLQTRSATRQTTGVMVVFRSPTTTDTSSHTSPGTTTNTTPHTAGLNPQRITQPPHAQGAEPRMRSAVTPLSWPVVEVTAQHRLVEAWSAWVATRQPYAVQAQRVSTVWNPEGSR